jgi:4-hydroxy-tetrahydrodipicolinate reductase
MADQLKIGVVGCLGRMGQAIVASVAEATGAVFAAGSEVAVHPGVGKRMSGTDVIVGDDAREVFSAADVVIDFTPPGNTAAHAVLAAETGTALIVGTTGFTEDDNAAMDHAAEDTALVQAGNYSLGVNLLTALVKQAASKLGAEWDIEVLEMHHKHKVDAPSGTALMLGEAAAEGRDEKLDDIRADVRDGITGEREKGSIGFAALRGGSVIGEHDVIFASGSERLTLSHKAENRTLFADGAVRAAIWVAGQKPGRYTMTDVLGL